MRKTLSSLCATALAASLLALPAVPAGAAAIYAPQTSPATAGSNFIDVQYRILKDEGMARQRHSGDDWGRRAAPRRDFNRRGFHQRGGSYYYNGHRGYRHHRPGYRQYNGWWFPPAAFIAGAIIGGAMNNSQGLTAHERRCYARYKSYRASDNTYQPYNGPRRQCTL